MGAIVCLLVGFNQSQTSWSSASTIALIVISGVLFAAGIVNELYTKRIPIIPPRIFKTRTTGLILVSVFIHGFAFFAATYYLPLYFQSRGASPLSSGVLMIPFSLGASAFAVISGQIVSRTGAYRPTLWVAWVLMTAAFGLMVNLDGSSSRVREVFFLIVPAIGTGCLFQTPLIGIQAAMPVKDMATATATLGLLRQIGGTVGISAGGAVYISFLRRRINKIEGYNASGIPNSALVNNVGSLAGIQPDSVKTQVIGAYAKSISSIWLICTPMLFVGLIAVLGVRGYSLKRGVTNRDPKKMKEGEEPEPTEKSAAAPGGTQEDSNDLSVSPTIEATEAGHNGKQTKSEEAAV